MQRFYSSFSLQSHFLLRDQKMIHQMCHVLRVKKGDDLIFFETGGEDKIYKISEIHSREIIFEYVSSIAKNNKKNDSLKLFQALPKKAETLELVIQKMVELWVSEVTLFPSDFSQIRDITENKRERLHIIAREAMEQSWSNMPLTIVYENIFPLWMIYWDEYNHIVAHPNNSQKLNVIEWKKYALWIGPEGGWSPREVEIFRQKKCAFWSFHDHILRLETASIVGMGILYYELH